MYFTHAFFFFARSAFLFFFLTPRSSGNAISFHDVNGTSVLLLGRCVCTFTIQNCSLVHHAAFLLRVFTVCN